MNQIQEKTAMKRIRKFALAVLMSSSLGISMASAEEVTGGMDLPRMKPIELKHPLTDTQRRSMSELLNKFDLDNAQALAQLRVSRRQLHELLMSDDIDRRAAGSLQDKINSLTSTVSSARLNLMLAMNDILSPEQRQEMHRMPPPPMAFETGHPASGMPGFPPSGIPVHLLNPVPLPPLMGDPLLGCPPEL